MNTTRANKVTSSISSSQISRLIDNGRSTSSCGAARIVIHPTGTISPVVKAVRSGYIPERGTEQLVRPGDFVFEVGANRSSEFANVYVAEEDSSELHGVGLRKLIGTPEARAWTWLRTIPNGNAIEAWLDKGLKRGRDGKFLPDGWGWTDGLTISDRKKEKHIRYFFKGLPDDLIDEIVEAARVSPRTALPMTWKNVEARVPHTMDFPKEAVIGSMVNIDRWTGWVLWTDYNKVCYITSEPTSGSYKSNYAHEDPIFFEADEPSMPQGVVRAARLNWGDHTNCNHSSYGISWDLFKY